MRYKVIADVNELSIWARSYRIVRLRSREDGSVIYAFANKLPFSEKEALLNLGQQLVGTRFKKNLPSGVREVLVSTLLGQGIWFGLCPLLAEIPHITESWPGWLLWGGSDKWFISPDQLLLTSGGYSTKNAYEIASAIPSTLKWGGGLLTLELALDYARTFTEYWSQKKYGLVTDGVARAWGQNRPIYFRWSSFEVYQKLIGYLLKPGAVGTPSQIFSSLQGISGSLWRMGPNLALLVMFGSELNRLAQKLSEIVGLAGLIDRHQAKYQSKEDLILQQMADLLGETRFVLLTQILETEAQTTWKWNPFKRHQIELSATSVSARPLSNVALD